MMRDASPGTGQGSRGLALIVVLWGVALLTLLAAGFSFSMRTEAQLAFASLERARAAAAAEAGVRRLLAFLADSDPRRFEAVDLSMRFDDIDVALHMVPETSRIDLNAAPGRLIEGLIARVSASSEVAVSAKAVADAILDWRDTDSVARPNGAEIAEYQGAGRDYGPRNGAFLSVSELSRVMGVTPALYEALAPLLSVYAWSPRVDAMTAPRDVLLAVPGLSESRVDEFMQRRGEPGLDAQRAIALLAGSERYLARGGTGGVFSLSARATMPSGVQAARRAVVKVTGGAARPIAILAWFEELPRDLATLPASADTAKAN
jgi:general secretion pathway protein K